jgi:hypothetical protein
MLMMLFPYSIFFYKKKKKKKTNLGGENAGNFISLFLACKILLVLLPDILINCALIDFS